MVKTFDAKTRKKMISFVTNSRDARKALGLNQLAFWSQFGITQSGGSRYETGRNIPGPAQLLMALHAAGKFSFEDLSAVQQALGDVFKSSAE